MDGGDLAPQSQVILTGCWLTMKEISLLLGIIATCAPLPGVYLGFRVYFLCVCVCVIPTASSNANLIATTHAVLFLVVACCYSHDKLHC